MKKILFALFFIICLAKGYAQDSITLEEFSKMSQPKAKAAAQSKAKAQPKPVSNYKKYALNANLGITFGNYTSINFAPQIGYNLSQNSTLGTGIGFSYFKEDYRGEMYKNTYLSYNIFGRLYPIENIVIHLQPEISRVWWTYERGTYTTSDSKFFPSFLVGAGLRFEGVVAMIQYDLIQNEYSQYGNSLFYSVGYTFSF